jgi:hypothetical protein
MAICAWTLGFTMGRIHHAAIPPLIIERSQSSPLYDSHEAGPRNSAPGTTAAGLETKQASAQEEIYLCGARTKKGTPCSRRVHGPVRCWQHKGMRAMLPQEKLIVKE